MNMADSAAPTIPKYIFSVKAGQRPEVHKRTICSKPGTTDR